MVRSRRLGRARTVRLRLTLLYSGLFLVSGALLIALVYALVAVSPFPGHPPLPPEPDPPVLAGLPGPPPTVPSPPVIETDLADQLDRQRTEDLRQLLISSGLALAVMTGVSVVLGWLMAGRVLHPIGTMTATVRRISADNLDQRLHADGPDDELKKLADTFDDLLDRLEAAFAAQRRFVANASHELRTPLTLQRAVIEVTLADPGVSTKSMRAAFGRLLASGEYQERLIAALLTLARSQQGLTHRRDVDLATITRDALDHHRHAGAPEGPRITSALEPAPVSGDAELLERLVVNLLDNATRHNVPHGWVAVSTTSAPGRAVVCVRNSGPVIRPDQVAGLREPFRRLGTDRRTGERGLGLGLSIVAAIAHAHGAAVHVDARADGGLAVTVEFPQNPSPAVGPSTSKSGRAR